MEKAFRLQETAEAVQAEICAPDREAAEKLIITSVSTDSRRISGSALFIALRGERTDGHLYLDKAAAKGAAALVLSDPEAVQRWSQKIPVLQVKDTTEALARMARLYRDSLPLSVIAVSGSVGKTSVRDMTAAALRRHLRVHATPDNQNNVFGVPYTLLDMPADTEAAVIECGMDRRGELSMISLAAAPDIVILTNIGTSHIEKLGSRQAISEAKAELIEEMRPDGALLLNGEDPYLLALAEREAGRRAVYFVSTRGAADALKTPLTDEEKAQTGGAERERLLRAARKAAEYQGPCRAALPPGSLIELADFKPRGEKASGRVQIREASGKLIDELRLELPVPGVQAAANALYAAAVTALMGLPVQDGLDALKNFQRTGGRLESVRLEDGGLLLNDCYNASPESMKAAFAVSEQFLESEKDLEEASAVLGGVLELGARSAELHREIGRAAGRAPFAHYFLLGEYAGEMAAGIKEVKAEADLACFSEQDALLEALASKSKPKSLYLVKGSRGYALEKCCRFIRESAKRHKDTEMDEGE